MNREEFIQRVTAVIKLIRVEADFTQDKMAEILGISKKTLVQVEKGRVSLGWTATMAVCALFGKSEVLQGAVGGDPLEVVEVLAFHDAGRPGGVTLGGRVWWTEVERQGRWRVQQNLISRHYRILDDQDRRWASSFEYDYIMQHLRELVQLDK